MCFQTPWGKFSLLYVAKGNAYRVWREQPADLNVEGIHKVAAVIPICSIRVSLFQFVYRFLCVSLLCVVGSSGKTSVSLYIGTFRLVGLLDSFTLVSPVCWACCEQVTVTDVTRRQLWTSHAGECEAEMCLLACLFAQINLRPWRLRQYVSPKRRKTPHYAATHPRR
jgi:hypothetical protein